MLRWRQLFVWVCYFVVVSLSAQEADVTVGTDIFTVVYSQQYEQPLKVKYTVDCPTGDAKRAGASWKGYDQVHTSDNEDYKDNEWDRGHMAPANAFNCDKETIRKTFNYLNCALQHEGLNRGPWKELERFERNLAKFFDVVVIIEIAFDDNPVRVPAGAAIPKGFYKTIYIKDHTWKFYFPNEDVAGVDWFYFLMAE